MFARVGVGVASAAVLGGGRRIRDLVIDTLVIEGDSITSTAPDTPDQAFYSYLYQAHRSDKTVHVPAQGSRTLKYAAGASDPDNNLEDQRATDLALGPDIFSIMIGANDLYSTTYTTVEEYYDRLMAYISPIRASGAKVLVWETLPFGTNHPGYAQHNTRIDALNPMLRAAVGTAIDGIIPSTAHPVISQRALWLDNTFAPDGVHPEGNDPDADPETQTYLFEIYKAVIDPIFAGRLTNTQPNGLSLGSDLTAAEIGGMTGGSVLMTNLGVGINASVTVSGGRISKGTGTPGTGGITICNGETLNYELDHSDDPLTPATISITVGGLTLARTVTTGAAATPVTIVDHGVDTQFVSYGPTATFEVPFTEGVGLFLAWPMAGDTATVNGQAAALIDTHDSYIKLFAIESDGSDPSSTVVLNVANATDIIQLAAVTAEHGDIDSITTVKNTPDYVATPHPLPSQNVAGGGAQIGFWKLADSGAAPTITAVSGTTLLSHEGVVFNTEWWALATAKRTTTGSMSLNIKFGRIPAIGVNIAPLQ